MIDVLESFDYHAAPRASDEVLMFHHPDRERPIPVDPGWPDFWENDPIFNCLRDDLAISADQLVARLGGQRP
jgi:hypothetical protein